MFYMQLMKHIYKNKSFFQIGTTGTETYTFRTKTRKPSRVRTNYEKRALNDKIPISLNKTHGSMYFYVTYVVLASCSATFSNRQCCKKRKNKELIVK